MDWKRDQQNYAEMDRDWQWVFPSPSGTHQIIYTNPSGKQLLGYYSRVWGLVVFPFKQINK
jgi:hypothetical protein